VKPRLVSAPDAYYVAVILMLIGAGWLPSDRLRGRLARLLGSLACVVSRGKRRRIERSLANAFGRPAEPRIVRAAFEEFWREMLCWTSPMRDAVTTGGIEHLQRARDSGRGAILWESNAFGRRLLMKKALHAHGFAVHQVHGPNSVGHLLAEGSPTTRARTAIVRKFFDRREIRFVEDILYLPASDSLAFTRTLLEKLQKNAILCIAGDGHVGRRLIELPFLGGTIGLSAGMPNLAKLSGAPLLPVFCMPRSDGSARLEIGPPIEVDRSADRDDALRLAVAEFVTRLEALVRREPGGYRNWHLLAAAAESGMERADANSGTGRA